MLTYGSLGSCAQPCSHSQRLIMLGPDWHRHAASPLCTSHSCNDCWRSGRAWLTGPPHAPHHTTSKWNCYHRIWSPHHCQPAWVAARPRLLPLSQPLRNTLALAPPAATAVTALPTVRQTMGLVRLTQPWCNTFFFRLRTAGRGLS